MTAPAVPAAGADAAALATRGLNKSFGSLVVAAEVDISVPRGERYALIGPNGAGKTTLINLITGMLVPDGGRILLGELDITALPPQERVRRGLVRTFQINTLFPHLSALEAVTLAVCERRGHAGVWWRALPDYSQAIEEAYGKLRDSILQGDDRAFFGMHCRAAREAALEEFPRIRARYVASPVEEREAFHALFGVTGEEFLSKTPEELVTKILPVRSGWRARAEMFRTARVKDVRIDRVDLPEGGTMLGFGVKFAGAGSPMAGQNERAFPVILQYVDDKPYVVWPKSLQHRDAVLPLPGTSPYAAQ